MFIFQVRYVGSIGIPTIDKLKESAMDEQWGVRSVCAQLEHLFPVYNKAWIYSEDGETLLYEIRAKVSCTVDHLKPAAPPMTV
jgi:hypothetical protein